jgi:hypothetical protein
MTDLDQYAHVATRKDVLGVGIGAQPGEWETTLGDDCLDTADGSLAIPAAGTSRQAPDIPCSARS